MIEERDYSGIAFLNLEGMMKYGSVFPDGRVPVKNVYPTLDKLQGVLGKVWVYKVDLNKLTDEQRGALIDLLVDRSGQLRIIVVSKIRANGLPLLKRLTRAAIVTGKII